MSRINSPLSCSSFSSNNTKCEHCGSNDVFGSTGICSNCGEVYGDYIKAKIFFSEVGEEEIYDRLEKGDILHDTQSRWEDVYRVLEVVDEEEVDSPVVKMKSIGDFVTLERKWFENRIEEKYRVSPSDIKKMSFSEIEDDEVSIKIDLDLDDEGIENLIEILEANIEAFEEVLESINEIEEE